MTWESLGRVRGVYQHGSATGSADHVHPDGTTSPATGQLVSGLFTIEASDRAEAATLAVGCPAFRHGEKITVYELT